MSSEESIDKTQCITCSVVALAGFFFIDSSHFYLFKCSSCSSIIAVSSLLS
jgi:hypothetical protein